MPMFPTAGAYRLDDGNTTEHCSEDRSMLGDSLGGSEEPRRAGRSFSVDTTVMDVDGGLATAMAAQCGVGSEDQSVSV